MCTWSLVSYGQAPVPPPPPLYCDAFLFPDIRHRCGLSSPSPTSHRNSDGHQQLLPLPQNPPNQPEKGQNFLSWLKEWSGIIAIFVAVMAPFVSHLHFRKTRARSIRDEFWVRQVAYPHVLQPCLEFIEWCAESLPDHSTDRSQKSEEVRVEFRTKLRSLQRKIDVLTALEAESQSKLSRLLTYFSCRRSTQPSGVFKGFQTSVEHIEDSFITYLGDYSSSDDEELDKSLHSSTILEIQGQTKYLVESLYKWQNDL